MALSGLWSRLTSGIFGVGIGVAAADAMAPVIEPAKQQAWAENTNKVLALGELAQLVAQAILDFDSAAGEAARTGYDPNRVQAVVQGMLRAPAVGELLTLLRRGAIGEPAFLHGLRKAQLEGQYDEALLSLQTVRLSAQELATMVQRSIVPNDGLLPVVFDNTGSDVTPMPMAKIDTLAEAAASGYDRERIAALARIVGLPPAPGELLQLYNRGVINLEAYRQGVSEGNTRNEWADALFELRRRLITPHDYAELQLRGYLTRKQRDDGAALSGMTPGDAQLLYDLIGRSISVHQVTTGKARGGVFQGPTDTIPDEYLQALERGNLRPEYYSLAYANRYTIPSYFVMRAIIQSGGLTIAEATTYFEQMGWPPDLAGKAAAAFAGGTGSAARVETKAELSDEYAGGYIDQAEYQAALEGLGYSGQALTLELELGDARRAKRYREKVVDAIHQAYLDHLIDDPEASSDLATVGVVGQSATNLLALWALERRYTLARLSQAQVVKAYGKGLIPQADALQRLTDFGLSPEDAAVRLAEG